MLDRERERSSYRSRANQEDSDPLLGQLVSTEVHYIQRTLGAKASQVEIDKNVIAVRRMPWASIVEPD